MTRFLDATGPYSLPTGWHEVTTAQWCDLARADYMTVEARASYFAGRPIQVNGIVADALAFMLREPPSEGGLPYPQDLGSQTYFQAELLRTAVSGQSLPDAFPQVFGLFTACQVFSTFDQARATRLAAACLDWPITDTYPSVRHCLSELQRLSEKCAALSAEHDTKAGGQARAAGVERLGMFGMLNVLADLGQAYGKTPEEIGQWAADSVYLLLLQQRERYEFQQRLADIQRQQSES